MILEQHTYELFCICLLEFSGMVTFILSMKIIMCLLLSFPSVSISCGGGGGGSGGSMTTPKDEQVTDISLLPESGKKKVNPDAWEIPKDIGVADEDIEKALKEEKKIREEELQKWLKETSSAEMRKRPKGEQQDWPLHWSGLGPPNKGNTPPKWAIIKGGAGKPDLCFEQPIRGTCTRFVYRYGYNPFTENCERYIYGGCDGSNNNFYIKSRCEEVCVSPKKPCQGCDDPPKLHNFKEWYDLPHIPDDDNMYNV